MRGTFNQRATFGALLLAFACTARLIEAGGLQQDTNRVERAHIAVDDPDPQCPYSCGPHGDCNEATGVCECQAWWMGPVCEFSYADAVGLSWWVFWDAAVAFLNFCNAAFIVFFLLRHYGCQWCCWCCLCLRCGRMAAKSPRLGCNRPAADQKPSLREAGCLCNLVAALIRVAWSMGKWHALQSTARL